MAAKYPHIAREGWWLIGATALGAVYAVRVGNLWLLCAMAVLAGVFLLLFRDPSRSLPSMPDAVVAPVDGRVVSAEPTDRGAIRGEAMRVRIRIDHFGTYTARSPAAGRILSLREHISAGARLSGVSGVWVRTDQDDDIVFVMRGPLLVGRPAAFVGYGERLGQGQRCAYIRLASHAELYVPLGSRIHVKGGDRVRAGVDRIATLVRKQRKDE